MSDIRADDFRHAYVDVISDVMRHGERVEVRGGQLTRELIDYTLILDDPTKSLVTNMGRNLNLGIAAAEAAQLVGGVSDPQLMVRISANFERFTDAGIFAGAYGPRVRNQLPRLVERLKSDDSSRQAWISIWRPEDDLWTDDARDVPCTLGFQFVIRGDVLHMLTKMRSGDVYLGLPYDVFQFTQLQCTLANSLNVGIGEYHHNVGSLHIYERDVDALDQVHSPRDDRPLQLFGFGFASDIRSRMAAAAALIDYAAGRRDRPEGVSKTEDWYADTLGRYRP